MNDLLAVSGLIGIAVGLGLAALAVIALVSFRGDSVERTRAYGFVLLGFAVAVACTAVYALARLDDPLPLAVGGPLIVFLLLYAMRLRLASAKALRRSRPEVDT
jgi:peptidoglycan/LPS O-acetylase OafA/YrhL